MTFFPVQDVYTSPHKRFHQSSDLLHGHAVDLRGVSHCQQASGSMLRGFTRVSMLNACTSLEQAVNVCHVQMTKLQVEGRNVLLFSKREAARAGIVLPSTDARAQHISQHLQLQEGDFVRVGVVNGLKVSSPTQQ
jgi:hypothetical protein